MVCVLFAEFHLARNHSFWSRINSSVTSPHMPKENQGQSMIMYKPADTGMQFQLQLVGWCAVVVRTGLSA